MSPYYHEVFLFYVEGAEEEVIVIHYRSWSEVRKRLTTLLRLLKCGTRDGIEGLYTDMFAFRPIERWYDNNPDLVLKVCRLTRIPATEERLFYILMGKLQALGPKVVNYNVLSLNSKDHLTLDKLKENSATFCPDMHVKCIRKFPLFNVDVEQW